MITVSIDEAKSEFPDLLQKVIGEDQEIIISEAGRPVARLVPIERPKKRRVPGSAIGMITVADDFGAPMTVKIDR